jgi:hypothetical protein
VAAWQLCGCGKILGIEELNEGMPDAVAPAPATHTVKGTAVGLLEPVSLRLEHPDGVELARVEEDGTFAFEARLADGALYSVTFVGEPPCVLADATGVVEGNIPLVSLACESVLLSGLALSAVTAPALDFAPVRRTYDAEVSILQQSVHVTATAASADAVLTVDGVPVASGVPGEPIALALGENYIEIAVANRKGAQRVYQVSVARAAQIAQHGYGKASNTGTDDEFGTSVAVWGDVLVVGAPSEDSCISNVNGEPGDDACEESGAVYVFRRDGSAWVQEAFLKVSHAEDPEPSDYLGRSVAVWNDTIAASEASGAGTVRIFRHDGDRWREEARLESSDPGIGNAFGKSLTLWGDTLAVSAPLDDSIATGINGNESVKGKTDSGAVFVFRRTEAGWAREAYIKASNSGAYDEFGDGLALWQDTLAVGAPDEDGNSTGINGPQSNDDATDSGAVYLFQRNEDEWTQTAYVKASDVADNRHFGSRVALHEDRMAVASPIYMFGRSNGVWTEETIIRLSDFGYPTDGAFGASIALSDDFLAVGDPLDGSNATGVNGDAFNDDAKDSGAAYLFHHTGDTWVMDAYIKASNPSPTGVCSIFETCGDRFGQALTLWDGTLLIGAAGEDGDATGIDTGPATRDDNSALSSGAVYIFH